MAGDGQCGPGAARTLGDLVGDVTKELETAGIESARLDARLLVAEATGGARQDVLLHPAKVIGGEAKARLDDLVARRAGREPMSQILGRRGFYDLEFKVTSDVLTPRPDSEILIDALIARFSTPARVLDLGTGSGCLLLTLLNVWPEAAGVGVDISRPALDVARDNAASLGLAARASFVRGDWLDALSDGQMFDVIVCNPPYIPTAEIDRLDPEVARFEPHGALDGGPDGLGIYRLLSAGLRGRLVPGGTAAFEVGAGQAEDVEAILESAGLRHIETVADLAGIPRAIVVGA